MPTLTDTFTVADADEAWRIVNDLSLLGPLVPGTKVTASESAGSVTAELEVKMGSMGMTFSGPVTITESDRETGHVVIEARAREKGGQSEARADVTIALGPDEGIISAVSTVTGKAASMGEGTVVAVLTELLKQSSQNLANACQSSMAESRSTGRSGASTTDRAPTPGAAPQPLDHRRVTEVWAGSEGKGQVGSGYLISGGAVLTAGHVLDGPVDDLQVRPLASADWIPARLTWSSSDQDAALLHFDAGPPELRDLDPVKFGHLESADSVVCRAFGFPAVQPSTELGRSHRPGRRGGSRTDFPWDGGEARSLGHPRHDHCSNRLGAGSFAVDRDERGGCVRGLTATGACRRCADRIRREPPRGSPVSALVSQAGFRAAYEASGSVDVGLYAIDDDRSAAVEHQDPGKPDDAGDDASATGRRSSGDSADGLADQVDWVSDSPATNDLLGRRHLAQALAHRLRRLRQQDPGSSFLIHVDGSWGSGKSTLVELLARSLGSEFLVVRFDAWRQSLVGPPWWALLTSLRRTLAADASFVTRLSLRLSEAGQRVRRGGLPYLIGLAALLAAVAGLLVLFKPQVAPKAAGEFATSLSAVFAAVGTLWFGTRLLGKLLFWDSATGAKLFEQSDENPTESLAEHFAWLLVRARRPVMFVIDDLDRCGHDYVVDLLDAVQTLIRDVPRRQHRATAGALVAPYFVVAADGAWIRRSYEVRHEQFKDAVAVPGRPLGYLFLDKIFQLTIKIPSIGWAAQRAYLEQLLGGTQSGSMDMGRLRQPRSKRSIEVRARAMFSMP